MRPRQPQALSRAVLTSSDSPSCCTKYGCSAVSSAPKCCDRSIWLFSTSTPAANAELDRTLASSSESERESRASRSSVNGVMPPFMPTMISPSEPIAVARSLAERPGV